MKLIDLSLPMNDASLSYPGSELGIVLERIPFNSPGGTLSRFVHLDPHCGTHFDAPLHFIADSDDVASVPLMLPELVVVPSSLNPIPADVLRDIPELKAKAVLFSTGWEQYAGTAEFFVDYPVLSPALAQELVAQGVAIVGLDSSSVDPTVSDYPAHRILLAAGIPILEGLVNLPALIPHLRAGHTVRLAAFPLRIQDLEGSPVRAVAIVT
jgi:arylformamidase